MKFTDKVVLCNIEDAHKVAKETQLRWIEALLLRLKLDPIRIRAITTDTSYGSQAWRDYLVYENHISINKNGDLVTIEKHFDDRPKVILGKWEKPEMIRVKEGGKWHMQLKLKYSQLV
jgi:hypothetical protein